MKCKICEYNAPSLPALRNHWAGLHAQQYKNVQRALAEYDTIDDDATRISSDIDTLPVDIWMRHV